MIMPLLINIFRSAWTSCIDYVSDVNASDGNEVTLMELLSAPPPSPFNLPQYPSPLAYTPYTKVHNYICCLNKLDWYF